MGLIVLQAHPTATSLTWGSWSSDRRFAAGFFQIPPHGGNPCFKLTTTATFASRYEHGNNVNLPRPETLKKIADFFGVPLKWLLSPVDNLNEPLPVTQDYLAELRSKYYLTMALRCLPIPETKIPEAVDELVRITRLLVAWGNRPP